jgi:hypothetical protein
MLFAFSIWASIQYSKFDLGMAARIYLGELKTYERIHPI